MSTVLPSVSDWTPLTSKLGGTVILPDHDAYDATRAVWNGMIDLRPAAIARCKSVEDVQSAVEFGRQHGLELAIRGGGHSAAGLGSTEGGLVIDLSEMNAVQVDPEARTAVVQGGAKWKDVDEATTAHGLATTGGVISTTGVGGLTLGGGIGTIMRLYGLACDNLLSAELVLATGEVVTADSTSHPDLFWALKGGGGNFGVVTEFTFRLHPMPGLYGGMILHPRENALAAIRHFRDVALNAPDELGIFAALLHSPEGLPIVAYLPWYVGTESEASFSIEPLRTFGPPMADLTAQTPYTVEQTSLDEGFPPGMHVYWKSHFLSQLTDEAIATIVEHANQAPSPLSATLLETMGGAVARVPVDATAFPHRDAAFNLAIITRWLDPADSDVNIAWARSFFDAMQSFSSGVYVNYLGVGDDSSRVSDAYAGATHQRLRQVKRQYDPDNLFHRNQNLLPA